MTYRYHKNRMIMIETVQQLLQDSNDASTFQLEQMERGVKNHPVTGASVLIWCVMLRCTAAICERLEDISSAIRASR